MITEEYRQLNKQLHATNETYGTSGMHYAGLVRELALKMGVDTFLDYGCGKQTLANTLPEFKVHGYDPAIEGLDKQPEPHDLVVCTDVLEHIEPEFLDIVLDDLVRVTRKTLFLQVATRPAKKVLADGRNAHLIVEHRNWWIERLLTRFALEKFQNLDGGGFVAVLGVFE